MVEDFSALEEYPKEYSKHSQIIMDAVSRGYNFDFCTGQVTTPKGTKMVTKAYGRNRYPSVTINDGIGCRRNVSFRVHKFVGYILYGEIALRRGVNVRHKDDNPLNLSRENITIGTSQDNNLDKSKDVRHGLAKNARHAQGSRPLNTIISEQEAEVIIRKYLKAKGNLLRAKSGTLCEIMKDHPYNRSTLQTICSGRNFPDVYEKVKKELEYE